MQDDTGIVGFEFTMLQLSPTSGFVENISRTNPGTNYSVAIWEENPDTGRICYLGANDGDDCVDDADCPDGRCGGLPMAADSPVWRSDPHNLGDGVMTVGDNIDLGNGGLDPTVFLNFGAEVFQAVPGKTYWVGITGVSANNTNLFVCRSWGPMSDCGGPGFEQYADYCDGLPSLQQSDPSWTPWSPGQPQPVEITMTLYAFPRDGGSAVVTLTGTGNGGSVSLIPITAPIPSCGEACTSDLGDQCGARDFVLPGGMSAENAAAALAAEIQADIDSNDCVSPEMGVNVEVRSFGNRVVFRTDDGSRPKWCLGGTPLGGGADCEGDGAGLHFRVGPDPDDVLPTIGRGIDRIGTGDNPGGTVATIDLNLESGFFGPGSDAFSGTVDLVGVARADAVDNSPITIQRGSDIVYSGCSGDGVLTGTVDQADEDLFDSCVGQTTTDCLEKFDYDGDGDVDASADGDVFDCLRYTENSSGCCSANSSTDPPQAADTLVVAELARVALRSAQPIDVSYAGGGSEPWMLDVTLSSEDPLVGAESAALGQCDDLTGSEPNDWLGQATGQPDVRDLLGGVLVADPRTPVRIRGEIGTDPSTEDCRAFDGFVGDADSDIYRFVIAPEPANVSISVAGRLSDITECGGGTGALTSVWLYDEFGNLIEKDDGVGRREPEISEVLNPGTYFVLVASGGAPQTPDISTGPCSVTSAPDININGQIDPTGVYDLNMSVVDSSTYKVTQTAYDAVTGAGSGTFQAALLLQGRLAFHPIADPFRSAILDTGEPDAFGATQEAWNIRAEGDWVSSLSAELHDAGVQQGNDTFVIGVTDNGARGGGGQSTSPMTFTTQSGPLTIVAEGWTGRNSCENILDDAAYVQELNQFPAPGTVNIRAREDEDSGPGGESSPVADRFILAGDTTIGSVSLFVTPIVDEEIDDYKFDIGIYPETTLDGGCPGPDMSAGSPPLAITTLDVTHSQGIANSSINVDRITLNLPGNGAALTGGTPYWLVVKWNRDATELVPVAGDNDPDGGEFLTPSTIRFMQAIPGSANTDGTYLHDAEGTGSDFGCDPPGLGNGFQCTAREDDPNTENCDESDADGDLTAGNLAFSLHAKQVARRTKALPSGLAQGSWATGETEPVWSQPWNYDVGNSASSDDASRGGLGSRQADNFTAFEEMNIRYISWWGWYFVQWDTPTVRDKFTIRFYTDLNGLPGQLRISIPIDTEDVTREPVELAGVPGATAVWKYSVDLFEAFGQQGIQTIPANETEWISIANDTAATDNYWWRWARGAGGDSDGIAASFEPLSEDTVWQLGDQGQVENRDCSFELSEGAPDYDVDVVSDALAVHLDATDGASGLTYINGSEEALDENGDPNPEADTVRWRFVSAPLKLYDVFDAGDVRAGDLTGGTGVLGAGMAEISQEDLDNLLGQDGSPGPDAIVSAVFRGLADYAANAGENRTDKHGTIDFLCDNGIAYSVDPAQGNRIAGPQALEVKGLLFADGPRGGSTSGSTVSLFKARDLAVLDPNSGQRTLVRDCEQGGQIECGGEMIDCPVDGTCPVPLGGVPCATNEDCATSDVATFCTFDSCVSGQCEFTPGKFGDIVGAGGSCGPDGSVALNDIIAVLDGFAGSFRDPCTEGNIDIGGTQGSCVPDGGIDLADIIHVLDAFSGVSSCGAICASGGPAVQPPSRRLANRRPGSSAAASFTLVPSERSVRTGGEFSVDVYVSGASGLRGYQVSLAATGGRSGSLELVDAVVWSERSDFVLTGGAASVVADDVSGGRLAAALYDGDTVDSGDNAYLGTFTFRASDDAAGGFEISIQASGTTLVGADSLDIAADDASTSIRVGSARSQRSKVSRRR